MIKAFKALIVTTGLTLALTASNAHNNNYNSEQLLLDDLYACHWWPVCKDPEEQKPMPSDSSAPKPSGDKDTSKDNNTNIQLA